MTVSDIVLRRARRDEADAIARLFVAARRDALSYLPEIHTEADTHRFFASHVLPNLIVWVALDGETILGFLALHDDWVEHLYLRPGHYRRGIGSRLLALAKQARPTRLRLYTFQRNARARAFYEAHGFTVIETTDGAANEEKEPDVLYGWSGAPKNA